jgi:hypothetical protein
MISGNYGDQQLIPTPQAAPPSVKHLPLDKRIEIWEELVDQNDAFVRAGLRAKIGPQGDFEEAYRAWYSRQMAEHERALYAFAENLERREAAHGE